MFLSYALVLIYLAGIHASLARINVLRPRRARQRDPLISKFEMYNGPDHLHLSASHGSISAAWKNDVQDIFVSDYVLSYGIGHPYDHRILLPGNQTKYRITGLKPKTLYTVKVSAIMDGYETVGKENSVLTLDYVTVLKYPPTELQAVRKTSNSIEIQWFDSLNSYNDTDGDLHYLVLYKNQDLTLHEIANTTRITLKNLKPATLYEIKVKSVVGDQESEYSMTLEERTDDSAPDSPPRNLKAQSSPDDPGTIWLSWEPVEEHSNLQYVILYFNDNDMNPNRWNKEICPSRYDLKCPVRNLLPQTLYHFKVCAKNSFGMGPFSEVILFRTQNHQPTRFFRPFVWITILLTFLFLFIGIPLSCSFCYKKRQKKRLFKKANLESHYNPSLTKRECNWNDSPKLLSNKFDELNFEEATPTLFETHHCQRNSFTGNSNFEKMELPGLQTAPVSRFSQLRNQKLCNTPFIMGNHAPQHVPWNSNSPSQITVRPIQPKVQYVVRPIVVDPNVNSDFSDHRRSPSSNNSQALYDKPVTAERSRVPLCSFSSIPLASVKPQAQVISFKQQESNSFESVNQVNDQCMLKKKEFYSDMKLDNDYAVEMANIEGIMKDLNAFTAKEFDLQ